MFDLTHIFQVKIPVENISCNHEYIIAQHVPNQ